MAINNMSLEAATLKQLLEAERLAIKYSPRFALVLSKEYYRRNAVKTLIDCHY